MTKHTPGPWKVHHTFNVFMSDDGIIAIPRDGSAATIEANARLIAAAPETAAERDRLRELNSCLLAALKRLHCIVSANCCTCDDCRGAEEMALEAIRKAETR